MGNGGKALQTLGVIVCVGGLVWAGFALGRVKGKREGRSEVEARWAHARSVVAAERGTEAAAMQASPLARIVTAIVGDTCVDEGPSQINAPHFCRFGNQATVRGVVHWWGPAASPARAYVAFTIGEGATPEHAAVAVQAMTIEAVAAASQAGIPDDLMRQVSAARPEVTHRSNGITVALREHRMGTFAFMYTLDMTAGD